MASLRNPLSCMGKQLHSVEPKTVDSLVLELIRFLVSSGKGSPL